MSFRIKRAETALELDLLFQARHRVFAEEMKYTPPIPGGRLLDRFDAFGGTANFVVLDGGQVVGGVRGVEDSEVGLPPEAFFDFRPHLLEREMRACAGSMLFMSRDYRNRSGGVTPALLGMLYCWALARGATHVIGVAAPVAEPLFLDNGYRALSARFLHAPTRLYARPVMLDLARLDSRLVRFLSRHRLPPVAQCFDRLFCRQGEVLSALPSGGPCVYLVLDGRLAVDPEGVEPSADSPVLEPGDIFGELAVLSPAARTARAVALTEVELAVVGREALPELAAEEPRRRQGLWGKGGAGSPGPRGALSLRGGAVSRASPLSGRRTCP